MYFDLSSLKEFHQYWKDASKLDRLATSSDLLFKESDTWLSDSAVIDIILKRNEQWVVGLIFAHPTKPSDFIIRYMRTCPTLRSAEITASHMRRLAAKDPRGTVTISIDNFSPSQN